MAKNKDKYKKLSLLTGEGMWHVKKTQDTQSIQLSDGPHGLRKIEKENFSVNKSIKATCFPSASAIASSWNKDTASLLASSIAEEALAQNISLVLGPGINIKRSPLCGRNFEYFSEDPFLTAIMATSYIKAMQKKGVGTSLKHFAANSQETLRMSSNSQIDERALREIYLRAFELTVKNSSPASIMASYNKLNGTSACENKELLTDILRKQWGFKGLVISDWGACIDMTECLKAGLDLEMPSSKNNHLKKVKLSLEEKSLDQKHIDRAIKNITNLEKNYPPPYLRKNFIKKDFASILKENNLIAQKLAEECAVLLKNDNNILPLNPAIQKKILILGSLAENFRFQGGGSSHINAHIQKNCIQTLEEQGFSVEYKKAYKSDCDNFDKKLADEAQKALIKAASQNIPVLFFGGLADYIEGEGFDRQTLNLPQNQVKVIEQLAKISSSMIFIAIGGSPFIIPCQKNFSSILLMYLSGQAGSQACARIIAGKVNPSGKLAETFPLKTNDIPCSKWFAKNTLDIQYRESIFTGYRYYDTFKIDVNYCFGHGLSYTTFEYTNLVIKKNADNSINVKVTVKNTGKVNGSEIVQIYVKNPKGNIMRPSRELRAFEKINLDVQKSKTLTFKLTQEDFSVWNITKKAFTPIKGIYEIQIAASLNDIRLSKKINIDGEKITSNDKKNFPEYFIYEKKLDVSEETFKKLYNKPLSHFDKIQKGQFTVKNSLNQLSQYSKLAAIIKNIILFALKLVNAGKNKNDPEVKMMQSVVLDGSLDCIANQSGGFLPYRFIEALVLSANGKKSQAWKMFFTGN